MGQKLHTIIMGILGLAETNAWKKVNIIQWMVNCYTRRKKVKKHVEQTKSKHITPPTDDHPHMKA